MLNDKEINPKNINYLLIFALFQMTIYITSCVVAYRLIGLGPIILPGPPFIFPLSYVISDIIAELYGPKIAKKIIVISLLCEVFFALIIKVIIRLPAPGFWENGDHYFIVLDPILEFIIAGIIAVLLSSWINVNILQRLKIRWNGKRFILRSIGSSAVGGMILVLLTMIFGYSREVTMTQLINMAISVYFLELIYAIVFSVPAKYIIGFVRLQETKNIELSY